MQPAGNQRILLINAEKLTRAACLIFVFSPWAGNLMVRERRVFKNCPHCGANVRDINFNYHLARVHSVVTESLREEQEILDEVAFIEDYIERKSLDKPLKDLEDLEKMIGEAEEEWRRPRIPSAGTMGRFMRRHHEEASRFLQEAYRKQRELRIDLPQPMLERNEFVEKAERTGRFRETVLEVEEKKRDLGGSNPDRWGFEVQFAILNVWKPGFEEHLTDLFFSKERCGNCKRPDKEELRCEEGYSNCLFDDEFQQFEFEYVRGIVDQLKDNVEPVGLEIPKHIRDAEVRMRELGRRMREGSKQEG